MKWNNLKSMKCPKCEGNMQKVSMSKSCLTTAGFLQCSQCDFKISNEKFEGLVNKLYHSQKSIDLRYKDIEDNLQNLNNLGRTKVVEDFSDSPYLNQ